MVADGKRLAKIPGRRKKYEPGRLPLAFPDGFIHNNCLDFQLPARNGGGFRSPRLAVFLRFLFPVPGRT